MRSTQKDDMTVADSVLIFHSLHSPTGVMHTNSHLYEH